MRQFDDVLSAYRAAAEDLDRRFLEALLDMDTQSKWRFVEGCSRINSQAYFALLFSQLETEINELCGALIRHRQSGEDWMERRAWEILGQKDVRNIHFMDRTALLTRKGGTVYNRIKQLYDTRNKIAHGDLLTESLDVAEIAKDIERIAVQLKGVT